MTGEIGPQLPRDLDLAVRAELEAWRVGDKVKRLWSRDASLWTGADEASWLGWLGIAGEQLGRVGALRDLAHEARAAGFTHALVLGMGGSSLCPEVLKTTFGQIPGHPELFVLDSTDPVQIRAIEWRVEAARASVRDRLRVATCLEFGPRYLHSTGQAYKGGPNSGVFVLITCDDADDVPVPGRRYSFGVVKAAQALGDLQVLRERGRRAVRVHLGSDVKAGLALLRRAIEA